MLQSKNCLQSVQSPSFSFPTNLGGWSGCEGSHKNWSGSNGGGWKPNDGFEPVRPNGCRLPHRQKRLVQAVHDTPLTFGTVWDNSFDGLFT